MYKLNPSTRTSITLRIRRPRLQWRSFLLPFALACLALAPVTQAETPKPIKPDKAASVRISESYGKLPLSFEANNGQQDRQVKFLSRGRGYNLFLTNREAVLVLTKPEQNPKAAAKKLAHTPLEQTKSKPQSIALRTRLVNANPETKVGGKDQLPGKVNYFIGRDPSKWRTNVPTYAKVRYNQVYPGIDLVYYGNQGQLEYDFVVKPGADPARIRLQVAGARKMYVDSQGQLVMRTAGGSVHWNKPRVYQETAGERHAVEGKYVLRRNHEVGFEVAAYNRAKPLIIDPVLLYSTYLGGSTIDDGLNIAADASGNAYVTGETYSSDFPITAEAFQTTIAGPSDAFITKLNPTGTALLYSTFLGGGDTDGGFALALDSSGNAYVTGATGSSDFPTTAGAPQTIYGGGEDAFVTELDPSGASLLYSSYLGGSDSEIGRGIAVDSSGNAYVTGETDSSDFPTTAGTFQTTYAVVDVFVTKFNPTGTALLYSTYLGGSGIERGYDIAVDSSGNAYVTGDTESSDFPVTAGAFQTTYGGFRDVFVTQLNPYGTSLLYSTYLGGSATEDSYGGIAVDASGNAYVTGQTFSSDFPITAGAFQTTHGGFTDAFVTELNPTGSSLLYSTYLGGSGFDGGLDIAVDSSGNAYVTGQADSSDFPTTLGAFQTIYGGGEDAFVTELNPTGTGLLYSTYLGGSGFDSGLDIAVDSSGNAYVTGETRSSDFPTTAGAFQTIYGGNFYDDAFVAKLGPLPTSFVIGNLNAVVGNHVTFWGAQWAKQNSLSGGSAPSSFKGFADSPNPNPPACEGTWQGRPGNSSKPPESVPSDITVIVSSSITKSRPTISGDVSEIAIVHTDPGYAPDPAHPGTGTVTAIVCSP